MERLACVADLSNPNLNEAHSDIRIFDLHAADVPPTLPMTVVRGACIKNTGPTPSPSACGALEYDYMQTRAAAQRRVFSSSGRWFAFATSSTTTPPMDDNLYVADLAADPMQLVRKDAFPFTGTTSDTSRVELAFSPNEQLLIEHRGDALAVHDLTAGSNDVARRQAIPIGMRLRLPTLCSEDFFSAPDRWCGNARNETEFDWSPNSRRVAFDTDTMLKVVDLGMLPAFETFEVPMQRCTTECSDRPVFQP